MNIDIPVLADLIKILFVSVLGTAALIITKRTLTSLFTIYAVQSSMIAIIALILFIETGSVVLLLMGLLTVVTKAILIPSVLRRIQKSMNIKRDLEFRYLTPIGSLLASAGIIILVYQLFSRFLTELSPDPLFFFGAVIGVSLALMGMLAIITRHRMITKIMGYLIMENGVLLFSLFLAELPLIIELLIIVDFIMLIVLSTVLAFGIDSTIEDFHEKLNTYTHWFKE
jgi:hydrogenase-4 component E